MNQMMLMLNYKKNKVNLGNKSKSMINLKKKR